jgi:hypothetical protein
MLPEPLRVLLLGSGGREHALAWKLCQSPLVELIVVCPGNVATEERTKTKNCKYESLQQALSVSKSRNINLAVFTNEADLAAGAVDLFSQGNTILESHHHPTATTTLILYSVVWLTRSQKEYHALGRQRKRRCLKPRRSSQNNL